jgi:hypothetical protein
VSVRTLQLVLSGASICVSLSVLVLTVLSATRTSGDIADMDLSRGRDWVLVASVAFLGASCLLFALGLRAVSSARRASAAVEGVPEGADAVAAEEAGEVSPPPSLEGDELRLYEMIAEAGGEILQMQVVSSKVFSKAKVTRLLDKLEKRGLVVRERHGMTNRIRLIR